MELSGRRGPKRLREEYGADMPTHAQEVDRARWYGTHAPPHISSLGLSNLGSHHLTLTPDFATQFPHLASLVGASDRLDLTGAHQPVASYLPPSQPPGTQLLPQGNVLPPHLHQSSSTITPLDDRRSTPYVVLHPATGGTQLLQPSAGFPQRMPLVASHGDGHNFQRSEQSLRHSAADGRAGAFPFPKRIRPGQRPFNPRSTGYEREKAGHESEKAVPADNAGDKSVEENSTSGEVENPVEGMIFGCNNRTKDECKQLQLFGLPGTHKNQVLRVIPGSKLFLFNYDTKNLTGVFEATCRGTMNIFPNAFKQFGSFPAQVKIKRTMKVPSITMDKLKSAIPEIFYNDRKFKYELTSSQVEKLVELFVAAKDDHSKDDAAK